MLAGLEQSFATQLPELCAREFGRGLDSLESIEQTLALDNYEAAKPLDQQLGFVRRMLRWHWRSVQSGVGPQKSESSCELMAGNLRTWGLGY